jgi:hypothetical protein
VKKTCVNIRSKLVNLLGMSVMQAVKLNVPVNISLKNQKATDAPTFVLKVRMVNPDVLTERTVV